MKWSNRDDGWRKCFAILPLTLREGPTKTTLWLDWYWARFCGLYTEVSFTDPRALAALGGDNGK